ncbi:MFS transporter [Allokutzneria sp. NRRL B-24872]|uniref:MFS transporter n=1 Tax=Allokutzneria sp. NRRL B-24872 TaxID=1137961 RepID=UPI000A3BDD21|nr:MFS transporter [Allokutzneria sp. NRRL B-24872]
MLEALRFRDFRLLWGARLVAALGSWLLVIAIPAHVFQVTGSLVATGLTLVAEFLPPLVLGPVAGALADRWDRRRVMICADLVRAAVITLMLFATKENSLWLVYVALLAESAAATVFRPAAQAHTPAVVGTGSALSGAQSLNAVTDGIVRLVGPPAGAALLTLAGFEFLVLLDCASYLVSAVAIAATAPRTRPPGERKAVLAEIAGGLRVLRRVPIALALLPFSAVFLAANASLSALLVPFGVRQLGGSEQVGFVSSALGVGFLLGAVVIRRCVDRFPPGHLFAASQFATAIAFFVLFDSMTMGVALPAALAVGVFGSMTVVTPQVALQRAVPNEVLGRISAVFLTAEALAALLGALAGPALAQGFSLRAAMVTACLVTMLSALASALLIPEPTVFPPPMHGYGLEESEIHDARGDHR